MNSGLSACRSIDFDSSSQIDGLSCDTRVISSSESLQNRAIAGTLGGAILAILAWRKISKKQGSYEQETD